MSVCAADLLCDGNPLPAMPRYPIQGVSNLMEKCLPKLAWVVPANAQSLCLEIAITEKVTSLVWFVKVLDTNMPIFETVLVQQHAAFSLSLVISQIHWIIS
jgi:hypothetical protein